MTTAVDANTLVARIFDQMDAACSLILAADMACADLDNEPESMAIKTVLLSARERLNCARDIVEDLRAAVGRERGQ
jgi:hypothetical protein